MTERRTRETAERHVGDAAALVRSHAATSGDSMRLVIAVAAWMLACFPLLRHISSRWMIGDDVESQLLVLVSLAFLLWQSPDTATVAIRRGRVSIGWWLAAAAVLAYAVVVRLLPMTIAGLPAVAALLLVPGPWRRGRLVDPAIAGLLLLALPATMMVEMYFGYPLRLIASWIATGLLRVCALPVQRDGATLVLRGAGVWVDAPCSGVRMLWSGMWLALTASGLARFGWRRTGLVMLWALGAVVVVNALRVTGLLLVEQGLLPAGEVFHIGLGVVMFALGAVAIILGAHEIRRRGFFGGETRAPTVAAEASAPRVPSASRGIIGKRAAFACYALACLTAFAVGQLWTPQVSEGGGVAFEGWPTEFEGAPLVETPLTEHEAAFNSNFPGNVARFEAGGRVVIMRWVTRPTHRVHSASDCLKFVGWRITPEPLLRRDDGDWSVFMARKGEGSLRIRERCLASDGQSWADVPSWFWDVLGNRGAGPWWIVTVVE